MGGDFEKREPAWQRWRGRLSRYLTVRRAIHTRIAELDARVLEMLSDIDRADRRLQEEYERNRRGPGFKAASSHRDIVARGLEETFDEMATLESGLQRRWSRYTSWISLALSVAALLVSFLK